MFRFQYGQKLARWREKVREGFIEVFAGPFKPIETKTSRKQSAVAFSELVQQALGCITSAFARMPYKGQNGESDNMSYEEFIEAFLGAMYTQAESAYKDYLRKREEFRANLEPLDMAFIEERIQRKLDTMKAREERLAVEREAAEEQRKIQINRINDAQFGIY